MTEWELAAFGADLDTVIVACEGDNVFVAVAPDAATTAALIG
jgi:hypothetical protein